jgi:cytoskeletal protein CcmA (bactofilin family)
MEAVKQADVPIAAADAPADSVSCIGSHMSVVGRIACAGPAHVYGHIAGELSAADILVGDGARIEGTLAGADFRIAAGAEIRGTVRGREVTIEGRVEGTIRAKEVKLLGRASVEGEVFHQRLSMEEETLFEGTSRMLPDE